MKIVNLFGLFCLFCVGESFSVLPRVGSRRSEKQLTRLRERRVHGENYDATRRNFLTNSLITAGSLTFTGQPVLAVPTPTGSENGMATTKNKKIGGLALKIRSVGHIMVS
jgi:hypothetical protein